MKRILAYCSLVGLLIAGCDDDPNPVAFDCVFVNPQVALLRAGANTAPGIRPEHPCDYAKAMKNGIPWAAHASTYLAEGNDTLHIGAHANDETLVMKLAFTGPGTYRILPSDPDLFIYDNAFFFTTLGGDVVIDRYHLMEEGLVEVLEYNESENTIKGTFRISLVDNQTPPDLKTMIFTKGSFSVHLPD